MFCRGSRNTTEITPKIMNNLTHQYISIYYLELPSYTIIITFVSISYRFIRICLIQSLCWLSPDMCVIFLAARVRSHFRDMYKYTLNSKSYLSSFKLAVIVIFVSVLNLIKNTCTYHMYTGCN